MSAVSLGNPQSLNLYAYCQNDPINFTDPSGLLAYLPAVVIGAETGGPVGVIAVLVVIAVITALGLIFRGRAKDQTRIVGQAGNVLRQMKRVAEEARLILPYFFLINSCN